jgi:hypothetical protein
MCITVPVIRRRRVPTAISEYKTATPNRGMHRDRDSTMQQATAVRVTNHKPRLEKPGGRVRVPSPEPVILSHTGTRYVE